MPKLNKGTVIGLVEGLIGVVLIVHAFKQLK